MRTFHSVGGEESQVPGFQWVLMSEFGGTALWLRLSGQGGVVHLNATHTRTGMQLLNRATHSSLHTHGYTYACFY